MAKREGQEVTEQVVLKPSSVELLTGSGGALLNMIDDNDLSLGYLLPLRGSPAVRVAFSGFDPVDGDISSAVFSPSFSWPLDPPSSSYSLAWYARKGGAVAWTRLAIYENEPSLPDLPLGDFIGEDDISTLGVMLYFFVDLGGAADDAPPVWES